MNGNKPTLGQKIERVYQVLRERKRMEWFLFLCVASAVFFFFAISEKNETHALLGILMGCFAALQYKASNRESLLFEVLGENANLRDKLCLSEHEVEKLKLELNTLQAALKEGEKRRREATKRAKETANKTDETIPVAEQKTKRPAFKRKPKLKTDTPDENKN